MPETNVACPKRKARVRNGRRVSETKGVCPTRKHDLYISVHLFNLSEVDVYTSIHFLKLSEVDVYLSVHLLKL